MGQVFSMTGIGEAAGAASERLTARVRVWSLNSRGLEINWRVFPRGDYPELELACRREIGSRIHRGRIHLVVELKRVSWEDVRFNWEVAAVVMQQMAAKPKGLEMAPLHLGELLALPGFVENPEQELTGEEHQVILALVGSALEQLLRTRAQEAQLLLPSVHEELAVIEGFAAYLADQGENLRQRICERLRERVASLLGEGVDDQRVLQEAAFLAERSDVAEEQHRLEAHLAHFRQLLEQGGAVGRKLDFLVQEMLREINTAGSKLREVGMGVKVVEAKAAVERLREQCANFE